MKRDIVRNIVEKNVELRVRLFYCGFLFTNAIIDDTDYPFYGIWNKSKVNDYTLLVSPAQKFFICDYDNTYLVLVGHAYDPVNMVSDENEILQKLVKLFRNDRDSFFCEFNNLSGIFSLICINNDELYIIGDPTCMQTTFYTSIDNNIYISSHTNLLGDLLSLKIDSYINDLINYRFFHLFGNSLPGDLTQFKELKRLVPNHFVLYNNGKFRIERFYYPVKLRKTNAEIVDAVLELLKSNMELIPQKWNRPALSLTGGCDSKTTLACATNVFDEYSYFSYISSESEKVDAIAAKKICESLNLKHKIYSISEKDTDFSLIEETRAVLDWNSGDIVPHNKNDVRKRRFFVDVNDFDVEVKSWASEIGRAYYSKRFNNRKNFGDKPTPRKCTTLYKVFLNNRKLIRKTDSVFEEYLSKYFRQSECDAVPWQEQFFWEFRVPSWNGMVITGEHRYSFDITIPYNNRRILELLLSASLDDRILDSIYLSIRKKMNPKIDDLGISVTNLKHTDRRAKIENIYYMFSTHIK